LSEGAQGSIDVEIHLDTPAGTTPGELPTFGGLEVVTGEVRLHERNGSKLPEHAGRVTVFARQRRRSVYGQGAEQDHPEYVVVEPDALIRMPWWEERGGTTPLGTPNLLCLPFALRLPVRSQGRSYWSVVARFDSGYGIGGGHQTSTVTAERRIALLPPAPVRGLMACLFTLADFTLTVEETVERIPVTSDPELLLYRFAPPGTRAYVLEEVTLEIREVLLPPEGDCVRGRFIINPQERHWTEYLTGGRPHEHRPFSFPATVLAACAPGGGGRKDTPPTTPPNPIVVAALRDLLYPFLSGGQQGW